MAITRGQARGGVAKSSSSNSILAFCTITDGGSESQVKAGPPSKLTKKKLNVQAGEDVGNLKGKDEAKKQENLRKPSRRSLDSIEETSVCPEPEDLEDMFAPRRRDRDHRLQYHDFSSEEAGELRTKLLRWYHCHRRRLPWRGDSAPFEPATECQADTSNKSSEGRTRMSGAASNRKRDRKQENERSRKKSQKTPSQTSLSAFFANRPRSCGGVTNTAPQSKSDVAQANNSCDRDSTCVVDVEEEDNATLSEEPPVLPTVAVSPYATWVSEVMLQQTRVETVIEYYLRWMERFPTVETLANGTEEEVNALWAGLGYYRRARLLHTGSKFVTENLGGELPKTVKELCQIPGIGPYTAGAISSIAFNQPSPLVDGNVIRVFSRLRAIANDAKNNALIQHCWALAAKLVNEYEPGNLNQSLMELGATVCKPKGTRCCICPVSDHCWTRKEVERRCGSHKVSRASFGSVDELGRTSHEEEENTSKCEAAKEDTDSKNACTLCVALEEWGPLQSVEDLPLKSAKKKIPEEEYAVAVVQVELERSSEESELAHANGLSSSEKAKVYHDKKDILSSSTLHTSASHPLTTQSTSTTYYLLTKRPDKGLLAGQWEFPTVQLGSASCQAEKLDENKSEKRETKPAKVSKKSKKGGDELKSSKSVDVESFSRVERSNSYETRRTHIDEYLSWLCLSNIRMETSHAAPKQTKYRGLPSSAGAESAFNEARHKMDHRDVGCCCLSSREDVGLVEHIFSHVRHKMYVENVRLSCRTRDSGSCDNFGQSHMESNLKHKRIRVKTERGEHGEDSPTNFVTSEQKAKCVCFTQVQSPTQTFTLLGRTFRWMSMREMDQVGITTNMKKVLAMAQKGVKKTKLLKKQTKKKNL